MITHLLFKGLNSFNIGSIMFRKILAIIIAVLIFSLVFLAVKFTKVEVPNFNRNLIMLAVVDISAFGLVMWKFGCPNEKRDEEKEKVESIVKEGAEEKETTSNKTKDVGDAADAGEAAEAAEAAEGNIEGDAAGDATEGEAGDAAEGDAGDS